MGTLAGNPNKNENKTHDSGRADAYAGGRQGKRMRVSVVMLHINVLSQEQLRAALPEIRAFCVRAKCPEYLELPSGRLGKPSSKSPHPRG